MRQGFVPAGTVDITSSLPDWAKGRGHPLPHHSYEIDQYWGYIYMRCPKSQIVFGLHFEKCLCELEQEQDKHVLQIEQTRTSW